MERDYYRDQVEADWQHYYGLDLLDVFRGRISLRKASVLTSGLPAGAGLWRLWGGDNAWSDNTHLLNQILYRLDRLEYGVAGGKGRAPREQEPPPLRHVEKQREREVAESRKARRFMDRFGQN